MPSTPPAGRPPDSRRTTLDEWADLPAPADDQDQRGRHPSYGFPGKLAAARNHAPPGATADEIQAVAREAYDRGADVREVWHDYRTYDLTEF